jgi:hypothetical protein
MIKYFCDSCKIEKDHLESVGVPCHLYSMKDRGTYVDMDLNVVSGRYDTIHLCNKCKNDFYTAALTKIGLI